MQAADLDSTGDNVVEAAAYVDVRGYGKKRDKFNVELRPFRRSAGL